MTNNESFPNFITIVERQETAVGEACYVAYHPELPTCLGQGATPEEAVIDLAEATALALEYLSVQGLPIPQAQTALLTGNFQQTGVYSSTQAKIVAPSAGMHGLYAGVA